MQEKKEGSGKVCSRQCKMLILASGQKGRIREDVHHDHISHADIRKECPYLYRYAYKYTH
eukprot:6186048-Pleurochrysis_carterae.AAC.1